MARSGTTFQPGQSGNPGGRPKVMHDLREKCREMTPEVLEAMRKLALGRSSQSVAAGSLILAYGYGRPIQTSNHRVIRSLSDLSDQELADLLASEEEREKSDNGQLRH